MYKDTNLRSVVKGVSWRVFATGTTVIIIFIFFGKIELAITAGILEAIVKIILYWAHERIWQRIRWGRKKVEPFNLWFTGLPLSGKTTIADIVYKKLKDLDFPVERIDSKEIRTLIPEVGYSREDRNKHIKRIGYLVYMLQKNSISAICSFISPYEESRDFIKKITKNAIIVYVKASTKTCIARDYKGLYKRALSGEIKNFTGISDTYEEPKNADIILNTEEHTPDEMADMVLDYLKKYYLK